jgi:AcrR family transcriptional regulator
MAPVGRPPRINRQMIAEAAHELGLEQLTLKAVADHLGVSIAALYHYVKGKDDLLRLAAEYAASRVPLPEDHGQHWAIWLLEWATYNRDVFLARQGLLAQYLDGAISPESIAPNVDTILGVLVRQGFTVTEANATYELVSSCALGTAVATIRERQSARAGRSVAAAYRRLVRQRKADDLPYLRALLEEADAGVRRPFEENVATILIGVAIRRGDDWHEIEAKVTAAKAGKAAPKAKLAR